MELSFQWILMERGVNSPICQADVELQLSLPLLYLDSVYPCRLAEKKEFPCLCNADASGKLGGSLEVLAPSGEHTHSQRT